MAEMLNQPINKILPHIFEKDAVCIPPSTSLEKAGHFLFATSHYQDGIVVVEDDSPIGRLEASIFYGRYVKTSKISKQN